MEIPLPCMILSIVGYFNLDFTMPYTPPFFGMPYNIVLSILPTQIIDLPLTIENEIAFSSTRQCIGPVFPAQDLICEVTCSDSAICIRINDFTDFVYNLDGEFLGEVDDDYINYLDNLVYSMEDLQIDPFYDSLNSL